MGIRNTAITGLSLLALGTIGGCPVPNSAPQISVSEENGTPIRSTESSALAREYNVDRAIVLPINRGDVYSGNENFIINASDIDGPAPLTANFYATTSPFTTNIYQGTNHSDSVQWHMNLGAEGDVSRGTYMIARGVVDDGMQRETVGILGAISRGSSDEE